MTTRLSILTQHTFYYKCKDYVKPPIMLPVAFHPDMQPAALARHIQTKLR